MRRGSGSRGRSGAVNKVRMRSVKNISIKRGKMIIAGSGAFMFSSVRIPEIFNICRKVVPERSYGSQVSLNLLLTG